MECNDHYKEDPVKGMLKMFGMSAGYAAATAAGTVTGLALIGWTLTCADKRSLRRGTQAWLNAMNKTVEA
jgi:hypothetical protein